MPRQRKTISKTLNSNVKRQPERKCRQLKRLNANDNNNKKRKAKKATTSHTDTQTDPRMPNDNQLSILDLNDDCLMEIFHNLDALELCAVKDSCQRFRNLTEYHFQTIYNSKPFSFGDKDMRNRKIISQIEQEKVLKHFGKFIKKLVINAHDFQETPEQVLRIIGRTCNQNLQDFEMDSILLDDDALDKCKVLLSKLNRLSLDFCYGDEYEFSKCVEYSNSLKELQVLNVREIEGKFLTAKFWQLESLILKEIKCSNIHYIYNFFKLNTNLKRLQLIRCNFANDYIFKLIADNFVNIEEISVQLRTFSSSFEDNLSSLLKLNNLKRLEFNCGQIQITPFVNFLASKNIIEHFSISDTELSKELCNALSQLKSLKTLKLISMRKTYKNFMKILSKSLTILEEFYVVDCNVFTVTNVHELIENAQNLSRLVIKDCKQFTPFDCNQYLQLVETRRKCYNGRQLSVYLDLPAFKACKLIIPKQTFEEAMDSIKLSSYFHDDIHLVNLISDKGRNDGYSSYEFLSSSGDEFPDLDDDSDDFYDEDMLRHGMPAIDHDAEIVSLFDILCSLITLNDINE